MSTITAIVLTKNEENYIEDCLKSLSWTDEILVIDDCSTNRVAEIAKKYTDRVIVRDSQYKIKGVTEQRNFSIREASSDWVLFIDADERSTPEFAREVRKAIENSKFNGYYLPRKNYVFGKWMEHSDWYPDHQLHLFRKGKGEFTRVVHEQFKLEGKYGYIKSPYIHLNYETLDLFLEKNLFRYSAHEAAILIEDGYRFFWPDLIRKPIGEFLRRFFLQEGYKDGIHGLVACSIIAMHTFTVYARVWEKQGFENKAEKNFNEKVGKELNKAHKEINYWVLTSKINEQRNTLSKLLLKLKRKF